jgi:hypothetical protein
MTGGGDRNLGDMGQRGTSLVSLAIGGFCGVGDLMLDSDDGGGILGMLFVESALSGVTPGPAVEAVALADRVGLDS